MTPNIEAFLAMISHSEGTDRPPAPSDPYRTCYGYGHVIKDLSEHPAVTGEWRGGSLDSLGGPYIGLVSTAAGRYQINKPTWLECKARLGLLDFTAVSQDDAAIDLIKQHGALDLVNAGKISMAIAQCRMIWASLPGNEYGQPQASLVDLVNVFSGAGGSLA